MTLIGARAHEKKQKQPIVIDASIEIDIQKAVENDALSSTLDYSKVVQSIVSFLEKNSYELLESLAYHLSHFLIQTFSLRSINLKVYKPHATKGLAEVSVEYYTEK